MNFAFYTENLFRTVVTVSLAFATLTLGVSAAADDGEPVVYTYALLVGSNEAGPGQTPLNYAQDDALRMAEVLITLGHYPAENVERLLGPTSENIRAALNRAAEELQKRNDAGEQSVFFFYYSGHARADALNFGREKFALDELRERLVAMPATLSIIVLDACQSGAFSQSKGAEPTADFSYNSVQGLNTEGVAILASSSANELSQESENLRSSFFTNHLLVALRGAADTDDDGRVTLAEAYKYAYNHTLASTSVTAVGEQHVTFETELQGRGEVPLTYPAEANAHLRIPEAFQGRVLLQHAPSFNVIAELIKTAGAPLQLALLPGSYRAIVRTNERALLCGIYLEEGSDRELSTDGCKRISVAESRAKGMIVRRRADAASVSEKKRRGREGLFIELELGVGGSVRNDRYEQQLKTFDFEYEGIIPDIWRFAVNTGYRLLDNFALGLTYFDLADATFIRDEAFDQRFSWDADGLGLFAQGDLSIGGYVFTAFIRAGGGLTFVSTSFDEIQPINDFPDPDPSLEQLAPTEMKEYEQNYLGYHLLVAVGIQLHPIENFGFQLEARQVYSPSLDNELGETHDVGGFGLLLGLRLRTWK